MVSETYTAEQVLTGEGSSSRSKRPRLSSLVEDGENVGVVTATVAGDEVRAGTVVDLDLLDCSICCQPLSNPIFQCDNGHIACSPCCTNMRNICPSCTLPIGVYRCRIMERVVEAIMVPCPNAKHGCTDEFSYGKELDHEKECRFGLCYCPAPDCNYSGLCMDLYRHYHAYHLDTWKGFTCGDNQVACLDRIDKILVLQERRDGQEGRYGPLVVVQCFEEEQGVYVTVNCIAPCAPGVSEFSFQLSYSSYVGDKTMSFGLSEMNRIQKVSFQTPDKDFMFVPRYFLDGRPDLKLKICINRLGEEEDNDDDEEIDVVN